MAQNNSDWDELGRDIQEIIDRAVKSQDYQKLNQTIRQAADKAIDIGGKAMDIGGSAVRKAVDNINRPEVVARPQSKPAPAVKPKQLSLYGATGGWTTIGVLKTVGGSILSGVTFLALFGAAVTDVLAGGTGLSVLPVALGLGAMGGGIVLLLNGISNLNRINRFKTYRRTLGNKTHCTLERLAQGVGKSVKFVRRELGKMIGDGLFREGHIDNEGQCLITSHETYRYYEQSRLQLEQRQRQEAAEKALAQAKKTEGGHSSQAQEVLDRGNAFIAEIRRCNDRIPGEAVSAKIDRMEMIVRRIFDRAEADPKIIPDLKKLMDYYLPMTVKLLNAYADMDAQPIQGTTIAASKREIEDTLDTLNQAFENLLDDLFKDTALDVSSDISVLQTLLAQEGLTEDDLSKTKNTHNTI